MGAAVSSSQIVSASPSYSGGGFLTILPCSLHGDPSMDFSNMSPAHGLQFFSDLSSLVPFLAPQSFRNRQGAVLQEQNVLQDIFSAGLQVLPGDLLQHWLLSPWSHRSCQKPAPAWTLYRATVSFKHIWCGVSHRLRVVLCVPMDLHGLQVTNASPWSAPRAGFWIL